MVWENSLKDKYSIVFELILDYKLVLLGYR